MKCKCGQHTLEARGWHVTDTEAHTKAKCGRFLGLALCAPVTEGGRSTLFISWPDIPGEALA